MYEHFSLKSKHVLKSNANIDFDKFAYATFWIFSASLICLEVLSADNTIKLQLKQLRDCIGEMKPLNIDDYQE